MTTTIRTNGSDVIIAFDGRLNTATSAEANEKINRELNKIGTIRSLACAFCSRWRDVIKASV